MRKVNDSFEYQVGGSLSRQSPSYVVRKADSIIYEALKSGQYCYVLNSRQMGKSSLRVRVMERLAAEGIVCLFIDLTGIGTQDLTAEKWYAGIVQSLVTGSQLNPKIQWRAWWRERKDLLSPVQRLGMFIEEVLLAEILQPVVIFVDEIDRVLSQDFQLDDFFGFIRFCEEQRTSHSRYHRLTFALLGVATPSDLIRDKTQIPFNFGKAIALSGFQLSEAHPLLHGLEGVVPNPEASLQDILEWTGGQPFLSQKLCHLLKATSTLAQPVAVAEVARLQIIEQWETQDEPEHLRTIQDRLLRDPQQSVRLLGIYQDLLQRGEIPFDGSPAQMELRLTGLVVEQQGMLRIYNRIYASVFDLNWVQSQLAYIRPYAAPLMNWVQSQGQSEAFLLRGEALKNALTWALGKSLSDLDYQYLVASQNLDKQQTQTMLHATEEASQMLSEARQQTRRLIAQRRIRWPWLPGLMLGSALMIGSLKLSGLLQGGEWAALDQFFRWRLADPPDPQIVVVTIDESDITALGQWPVSDRVLAQALETIKTAQPAAIGLDIYRNLKVEPGHAELQTVFASTPNLFGIEKLVHPAVPPPPLLHQKNQVGFSDQILDADNRVRRALLSMTAPDQRDRLSLATLVALHYLGSKGIRQQELDPEGQRVRLGKTIFHRFQSSDGGYVRANPGGYQILLNWSGSQTQFKTVSFREVLTRRIPPEQWRDRIVLIGTTAESAKDEFMTPYSSGLFKSPTSMPGVFVHANITSQLIHAALAGRSPLQIWPDPWEWLWVLAWAGVGTALGGWYWRSLMALAIVFTMAVGGLVGISYFIFLQSWWIPLIPAGGALFVSMALLRHVSLRQLEQFQFERILQILVEKWRDNPLAGHIALEYFKQSESENHQRLIEQQLGALRIEPVVQLNTEIDSKLLRSLDRGEKIASS